MRSFKVLVYTYVMAYSLIASGIYIRVLFAQFIFNSY